MTAGARLPILCLAAVLVLAACSERAVDPVAPETAPAAGRPVPPPSTVVVPITVGIGEIGEALNALVPAGASGQQPNPIGGPVRDDVLTWDFSRTPIGVRGADNSLWAVTQIRGTVRVSGRIRPLGGVIGGMLGGANPAVPFSAHADLAATVAATARPELTDRWRLVPNLTARAQITEARIPVAGVTSLSVRGRIQPEVESRLAALVASLNARLASDAFLETAARKAWGDLCRSHPVQGVQRPDGTQASLFLSVEPRAVHAEPIAIDPRHLTLTLGVTAATRLSDKPETLRCADLPAVTPPSGAPGFVLAVEAALSWQSLSQELDRLLKAAPITSEDGALSLAVTSLALAPDGERAVAAVGFEARQTRWLGARFRGRLHIGARPVLRPAAGTLAFEDIRIDPASESALDAAGLTAKLLAPLAERLLRQHAVLPLGPHLEAARAKASAAVAALGAGGERASLAAEAAEVEDLRIDGLAVGPEALIVQVAARGTLRLKAHLAHPTR